MGRQQQQGRNDQLRYAMMSAGAATRPEREDSHRDSVTPCEGAESTPVEEGGRQGSSGLNAGASPRGGNGSGENASSGNGSSDGESQRQQDDQGSARSGREPTGARAIEGDAGGRDERSDDRGGYGQDVRRFSGDDRLAGAGRRRWRRSPQCARDVMTRSPKSVRPTDSIQQIAQLMVDEDTGIIPVVENGRLMGVVTDRDIVCRLVASGTDLKTAKASEVMTSEVECVTEGDSLQEVLQLMGQHQIRRVAVVAKDDRLVGIISMADLAREADVDESLQDAFEEISAERSFWTRMR